MLRFIFSKWTLGYERICYTSDISSFLANQAYPECNDNSYPAGILSKYEN